MPSGGPAPPPPAPAPAPIPSGSGGGTGGHRRQDRIHLEYMLRKFLGLLQHDLARSPIYIALITQGIRSTTQQNPESSGLPSPEYVSRESVDLAMQSLHHKVCS
jgi:hypothetical protein